MIDLLREFDGYAAAPREFRLIKDPYGILFLESVLVDYWDVLPADIAIKDFLWLAQQCDRIPTRFSRWGLAYQKTIGPQFMQLTRQYVERLLDFKYQAHWFFFDMQNTWAGCMWNKIKRRIGIAVRPRTMYFSKPSREQFVAHTQAYLAALFDQMRANSQASTLILDQAVPVYNPIRALRYLNSARLIVVDRDPRDSYVDMINRKLLIGNDLAHDADAHKFITWHKSLRQTCGQLDDPRILTVRFEDLCLDYAGTVRTVLNFLEEESSIHVRHKRFFDPLIARSKIGLWRDYRKQQQINQIYEALREDCYQR